MAVSVPQMLACTLQEQDILEDMPKIDAQETTRDGTEVLELIAYFLADEADGDWTAPRDVICLSRAAWATLVEMFALRYPDVAKHIVGKAQGWRGEHLCGLGQMTQDTYGRVCA
jgi:hypothetical protein